MLLTVFRAIDIIRMITRIINKRKRKDANPVLSPIIKSILLVASSVDVALVVGDVISVYHYKCTGYNN